MDYLVETIESKTGHSIYKINGYYLHSKYDPEREARKLAEQHYKPHYVHIIFGYGHGYLDEALHEVSQFDEEVIFIDPLFQNNQLKVQTVHPKTFYLNENIIDVFDIFLNSYMENARTNFNVICSPNYDKLFPETYKKLLQKVKTIQNKNRVNDNTLIRFSSTWQKNFIANLSNIANDYSLNELYQHYNCPVVVASGGPSLQKQLSLLKKIQEDVVIIAAGSTINSLLKAGIEPDYVVTIDGGEANYGHFKDLYLTNTKIIYAPYNHPRIRDSFKHKGYVTDIEGFNFISKYMKETLQLQLPIFRGGGSVANLAFSIAQFISSGPVALIGQDLAFTNNQTHASNNKHTKSVDEAYLKQREAFEAEGYFGDLVWTYPVFYSMKLDFEDIIKVEPPKVPFFNCTEGGIKLDGYPQLSFEAFCSTYVKVSNKVHPQLQKEQKAYFNVMEILHAELNGYNQLDKLLKSAQSVLKNNRSTTTFSEKTLKKLDAYDKKIQKIITELSVEMVTVPITMNILRNYLPKLHESAEEKYNRVYKQTEELYMQLTGAVDFAKKVVNEQLEITKKEDDK